MLMMCAKCVPNCACTKINKLHFSISRNKNEKKEERIIVEKFASNNQAI